MGVKEEIFRSNQTEFNKFAKISKNLQEYEEGNRFPL